MDRPSGRVPWTRWSRPEIANPVPRLRSKWRSRGQGRGWSNPFRSGGSCFPVSEECSAAGQVEKVGTIIWKGRVPGPGHRGICGVFHRKQPWGYPRPCRSPVRSPYRVSSGMANGTELADLGHLEWNQPLGTRPGGARSTRSNGLHAPAGGMES